jgi:hypothetical protein
MDDLEYNAEFIPEMDDQILHESQMMPRLADSLSDGLRIKHDECLNSSRPGLAAGQFENKIEGKLDIPTFGKTLGLDLHKPDNNSSDLDDSLMSPSHKNFKSSPEWIKNDDMQMYKQSPIFDKYVTSPHKNNMFTKRVKLDMGE